MTTRPPPRGERDRHTLPGRASDARPASLLQPWLTLLALLGTLLFGGGGAFAAYKWWAIDGERARLELRVGRLATENAALESEYRKVRQQREVYTALLRQLQQSLDLARDREEARRYQARLAELRENYIDFLQILATTHCAKHLRMDCRSGVRAFGPVQAGGRGPPDVRLPDVHRDR